MLFTFQFFAFIYIISPLFTFQNERSAVGLTFASSGLSSSNTDDT
jgi:hypothetical protein